jgi:outer membrane protein OmpA-like peptidoglycan-associated protein
MQAFIYRICAAFLFVFVAMGHSLPAQDDIVLTPATRYGVYAHALNALYNARFAKLAGTPTCCPENLSPAAFNLGFEAGVLGEWAFFGVMGVSVRAGFGVYNGSFSFDEQTVFGFDKANAVIRHSLNASISAASVSPMAFVRPFERLTLYAGGSLAAVVGTRFAQSERFITPDTAIFASTQSRERNGASGMIPQATTVLPSILAGLSYEFPLNRTGTTLFALEGFYSLGLTNLASGLIARTDAVSSAGAWTMSSVRVGASLRFAPEPTSRLNAGEVELLAAKQATIPQAAANSRIKSDAQSRVQPVSKQTSKQVLKRPPVVQIAAIKGVMQDGSEIEVKKLRVEEFMASQSRYVLPIIFFDANSSLLPNRYRRLSASQQAAFSLDNVEQLAQSPTSSLSLSNLSALDIYAHLLNIIGSRMIARPQAKLMLTGYADVAGERSSKSLAASRAQAVKTYLVDVWGMNARRISIQTAQHKPSANAADPLEHEEQRRVELASDTPALLEEIRFDYTLRVITPPMLRVEMSVDELSGSNTQEWWTLQAQQENESNARRTLFHARYSPQVVNTSTAQMQAVLWNVAKTAPDSLPSGSAPVQFSLQTDSASLLQNAAIPVSTLPVEHSTVESKRRANTPDERVDSYAVFAFNYGTNELAVRDAAVQRLVQTIKTTLKPNARVSITGYTDARGAADVNKRLSAERAQAVARLLNFAAANVRGVGAEIVQDSEANATPEGRFYRRFVQVDVRTPVRE